MTDLRQHIDTYLKTKSNESKQKVIDVIKQLDFKTVKSDANFFDDLVPSNGKADTIAGEILRATHRIGFSYYNDGFHYFEGAGIETSGSSAVYLAQHTNQIIGKMITTTIPIDYIAATHMNYENHLDKLINVITMFFKANPMLFMTRNTMDSTNDYINQAIDMFEEYDVMINGDGTVELNDGEVE